MISFYTETDFALNEAQQQLCSEWVSSEIIRAGKKVGEIGYVFLSDEALLEMNVKFLQHDTYTDIITFDDSTSKKISGEMYLSIDRIRENAESLQSGFYAELARVMIHGIWHMMGQGDKTEKEAAEMREKENDSLSRLDIHLLEL